jgi:hypothetical protein
MMKEKHSAKGITAATTAAALKLPKKMYKRINTMEIPKNMVCLTVPIVISNRT